MSRQPHKIVLCIAISLIITACAPFAPEKRVPEPDLLPDAYGYPGMDAELLQHWWESFEAPQLDALVQEALGNNFSLRESWARLKQAEALAVRRGADKYPDLTLGSVASGGRQRVSNGQTTEETVENYSLGLGSSYEIDLWGRIASQEEADILAAQASREDLNAAAMTVAANVTSRWVGIISQRMQKSLVQAQLKANQTVLELLELRFRKSLATALDVFQQRQLVEQSRAQLPLIEQSEYLLLHELTVLLGRTRFALPEIRTSAFTIPVDVPVTGLPAQLLVARPDIRAAMRRLESADWQVAAARADRLPGIRLNADATYQADELDILFENWLVNLAANLTAPLYDGRRRKAEVRRLEAVVAENLAAYRGTILTAIQEVEDALVSEEKLRKHLAGLAAQLEAARLALNEARSRYRSGLDDYLPVLTQLVSVQNLERTQIQRQAELLVARVNLYRALGGDWIGQMPPGTQ